eukprot:gene10886-3590_t
MSEEIELIINYNKETYPLQFDTNCTISKLKELVEFILGVPKNRQKILGIKNLNGKDEFTTLSELGLKNKSKITIVGTNEDFVDVENETENNIQELDFEEINKEEFNQKYSEKQNVFEIESDDEIDNDSDDVMVIEKQPEDLRQFLELISNSKDHPYFFNGTYDDAFDESRRQSKILISILYSESIEDSVLFCKKILSNEIILEMISNNFILWCGNIENEKQIASLQRMMMRNGMIGSTFEPKIFPATSLVAYFNKSISILDIIEGPIEIDNLISKLFHVLETYGDLLKEDIDTTSNYQKSKTEVLLDEQDLKYQEIVKKDLEKFEKEKIEKEKAEMERKQKEELENQKKLNFEKKKKNFPDEPKDGEKEISKILFRLSNGSKIERKFKDTDTIELLFDFLEVKYGLDSEKIELFLNFPKKNYNISNIQNLTLKSENLCPKAALFVKDISMDEE